MITPSVSVRLGRFIAPHRCEVLERLLDRIGGHMSGDGRALIECGQDGGAKQLAALLRHLGAEARAVYSGGIQA